MPSTNEGLHERTEHLDIFLLFRPRKSLVKPVTRQKTCNYNVLFGSSTRDRHARRIYR